TRPEDVGNVTSEVTHDLGAATVPPRGQSPATPTSSESATPPPSATPPAPASSTPQFVPATPARQVQPIAAAPKKKSKAPLVIGIVAVVLIIGIIAVVAAAVIFIKRPQLVSRILPQPTPSKPILVEPSPSASASPAESESPNPTPEEPAQYTPPPNAVAFINSKDNLDGKLAEHYVDFSFYYPNTWQKDA